MIPVKTYDSTGIAPNGRVYASDLNAIQAAAAGLTDLTQNVSVASLIVGEVGLALARVGAGEAQISGGFRSTGILRGLGGIYAGQFSSGQRDAMAAGLAPTGLMIFNTTTVQFEWNSGTDGARSWKPVGFDSSGDLVLSGGASSLDFTAQTAGNYLLTAKRLADTVARLAIKEDGTIEIGPGGAVARDVSLFRSGASTLSLGAAVKLILGAGGIQFSDGTLLTGLTDSITAAMLAANSVGASELQDASVDAAAIQSDAVTTVKILDGSVTLAKLAAQSVDSAKVANSLKPSGGAAAGTEALRALGLGAGQAMPGNQVMVQSQLGTDSVGAAQIIAGAVGASEIADGSIGAVEIAGSLAFMTTPITVVTGTLYVYQAPSTMVLYVPATGTYIIEWGFNHYDSENTNAVSAIGHNAAGGASVGALGNDSGKGFTGPFGANAGTPITISTGHQSGASAGRFDGAWAKLTRVA